MIDFFDAEEPSAALIMALDPRCAPTPDCYLREGGSIPTGLTLRVTAESRSQSREQTSSRRGSPVGVKDTSILRPYRDRRAFLRPFRPRYFQETGIVIVGTLLEPVGIGPSVG